MFYWLLHRLIAGPILKSAFRLQIVGAESVPKKGAVILASNHLSVIDSIFLPLTINRHVSFLAKIEYFMGTGVKGWAMRQFFLATGMLPMDRSGGKKSEASLQKGIEVLDKGEVLGIYPEGTRSPDGRLYRGRTGIARMVLEAKQNVTVVPVVMVDTEKVMPIGESVPRLRKVAVVYGKPIDFSRYRGIKADRFLLRSITDEIMSELHALGDQQFRDVYASTVRQQLEGPRSSAAPSPSASAA
ncbi:1-acyl-sn-glycerol-3-phosphate acyltransferase [Pseudoclavibacter endophyticus]|uniref:1-acyl-sn-glycerol-3-phosphate acyltransferase n=1 Tax=Pseudoclavibacter endophyticus TaxID=1778590 RepID=A0A6H9WUT6_9MICO|nr:lysophospholipid acyltransferase family protein [Pseudoclavibacter endophyticus]KAB1650264.1 1-acyl-sn-glycerol-3-phosphate acyltransferase [Pseudoclavibacter endophyticus]GGA55678.1 1-acyl-sn-glycerol-3-phosphate acyltransferase [Pseudoclavibacter endophyticus]